MKTTKVLIVDDSPEDVEFLASILHSQDTDYQVIDAHNSLQGLDELQNWRPDCVLLDFRLGYEDGIEVLHAFLSHACAKPVIMLTGQGSEVVAAAAIKAGASDYLVKMDINGLSLHKSITKSVESAQMRELLDLQEDALKRQSRLQALGHLSAGIAHDFNNMLATIRHAVDGAKHADSAEIAANKLDIILNVVNRAADRVQNLLVFTSAQSGNKTPRLTSEVIRELEEIARGPISKICDIEFTNDDPQARVHCDQTLLHSALLNLILNAKDAIASNNQQRGHISIVATPTPDNRQIEFLVHDNGGGIPANILDRVTDPYFTTKRNAGGTGLGLSLAYGFAQQCNSTLDIDVDSEQGTTDIRFRVPTSPKVAIHEQTHATANADGKHHADRRKILLVDDNIVLLSLIQEELEHAGFNVFTASDTELAMEQLKNITAADAVITDLSLGDNVTGLDLAVMIRSRLPNIQIIGITGYTDLELRDREGLLDSVLQKPCYIHELVFILNSFGVSETTEA